VVLLVRRVPLVLRLAVVRPALRVLLEPRVLLVRRVPPVRQVPRVLAPKPTPADEMAPDRTSAAVRSAAHRTNAGTGPV
jgi:hypothetical protein